MTYAILAADTITAHGPASVLWPDTSFAAGGPNPSFLADAGAVAIRANAPYDPATEFLQPCEPYVLNGEVFNFIAATIVPPPPPSPDYQGFYGALLSSAAYASVLQQSMTSDSPALATLIAVFASAIGEAMAGRVNQAALQQAVWLLLGNVTATEADVVELQGLLVGSHLDDLYTLQPPTP
jgi:hypothetical protein